MSNDYGDEQSFHSAQKAYDLLGGATSWAYSRAGLSRGQRLGAGDGVAGHPVRGCGQKVDEPVDLPVDLRSGRRRPARRWTWQVPVPEGRGTFCAAGRADHHDAGLGSQGRGGAEEYGMDARAIPTPAANPRAHAHPPAEGPAGCGGVGHSAEHRRGAGVWLVCRGQRDGRIAGARVRRA